MKTVREFMNDDVIHFDPDDSIFQVAEIFSEHDISGAPVTKNGIVIGVISESDIVKYMSFKLGRPSPPSTSMSLLIVSFIKDNIQIKSQLKKLSNIKIKNFMSKRVVSIHSGASLLEAASVMEKNDINRLPVIDDGILVGILARADLIKALISY